MTAEVETGLPGLVSGGLALRFVRDAGGQIGFVTDCAGSPAASVPNLLVAGGLALAPERVTPDGDGLAVSGHGEARGANGAAVGYHWSGHIRPCAGDGLAFDVSAEVTATLGDAPAIEVWLGPLSTMAERQRLTWRRSWVAGPVASTQGIRGNSVPAAYLYDPATGVETILQVDAGAMQWAPGRHLAMELRELFDYGSEPRYGLGLVPVRRYGLAAGRHLFRWRLWQLHGAATPDGWQASARLVDTLASTLEADVELPTGASWAAAASGTLRDLLDSDQTQVTLRAEDVEVRGLRAYARDAAHLYDHAPDHTELMTVADVVAPLLLHLRLHPHDAGWRLAADLTRTLARFHRPDASFIANRHPADGRDHVADTWYFLLNGLLKIPWVALAAPDDELVAVALDGLRGAERLAEATSDRLPLFADFGPGGPRAIGGASNASVSGLLAYGALLADDVAARTGRAGGSVGRGAALALRLLRALRREPVELTYHEPLQLGFAAAAAARLADAGSSDAGEMATLSEELVRAQLRMAYWDEDPEAQRNGYRVRGMFEACASLLYPAPKENVEAILPWTILLRSGRGPTATLLRFMNLIRVHSLAFLDPYLPRPAGGPAPWIPYENLGTSELPKSGSIGREIYGAGEVIWAYLLFEALARADDPAILVVYVDLLETETLRSFPPTRRRFVVFNPTQGARSFGLLVRRNSGMRRRPMALPPGGWQFIDVDEEDQG